MLWNVWANQGQCAAMDHRIRRAGLWDIEAVGRIERECFPYGRFSRSVILAFMKNPNSVTFVAEREGVVGSIIVVFHSDASEIASVAVLPSERRRGIGMSLMREAESLSERRGCSIVTLHVSVENIGAMNLYSRLGYERKRRVTDYYGSGKDAYLMVKELKKPG